MADVKNVKSNTHMKYILKTLKRMRRNEQNDSFCSYSKSDYRGLKKVLNIFKKQALKTKSGKRINLVV